MAAHPLAAPHHPCSRIWPSAGTRLLLHWLVPAWHVVDLGPGRIQGLPGGMNWSWEHHPAWLAARWGLGEPWVRQILLGACC